MSPLDCARVRQELAASRLGEPPGLSAEELRAHLESCAECRRAEAQAAALERLFEAHAPALPEDGLARLRAATGSEAAAVRGRRAPRPRPRLAIGLAAAAATAVMAAFLYYADLRGKRPEPVGVVTLAEGRVTLGVAGAPADPGREIAPGCELVTGLDGRAELSTRQGALLALGGNGSVRLAAGNEVFLDRGRLLVQARKDAAGFRVRTPDAEVQTLGTRFSVETAAGVTRVTVLEGRVRFRSLARGDGAVEVAAGRTSAVLAGSAPLAPEPLHARGEPWSASRPAAVPTPELSLRLARGEVLPGQRLTAVLAVTNASDRPLQVDGWGRAMPGYFLRLTDPAGRTSYFRPSVLAARLAGEPDNPVAVRLPPGVAYELELDLGGVAERAPGEYGLTAIYFGSDRWTTLESRTERLIIRGKPGTPAAHRPGEAAGKPQP